MTQRIFDIENEKDYADLWDILPDDVERIRKNDPNTEYSVYLYSDSSIFVCKVLKINWHNKTEITRPIQEVTEQDIGKLCVFWKTNQKRYGTLTQILNIPNGGKLYLLNNDDGWGHCRRLTKQEIEELC